MIKYKKILGLPIFSLEEGKLIGKAEDALFNIKTNFVLGICLSNSIKKNSILR